MRAFVLVSAIFAAVVAQGTNLESEINLNEDVIAVEYDQGTNLGPNNDLNEEFFATEDPQGTKIESKTNINEEFLEGELAQDTIIEPKTSVEEEFPATEYPQGTEVESKINLNGEFLEGEYAQDTILEPKKNLNDEFSATEYPQGTEVESKTNINEELLEGEYAQDTSLEHKNNLNEEFSTTEYSQGTNQDKNNQNEKCLEDPISVFKQIVLPFNKEVAADADFYAEGHFIISAYTVWLSLASIAESEKFEDESKFWEKYLYLPNRKCVRDQLYDIALKLEASTPNFLRNRALAIDGNVRIKETWIKDNKYRNTLPYMRVNYEDEAFARVQKTMGIEKPVPLSGHSVFLDRLDWGSFWSYPNFADQASTRGPFFNYGSENTPEVDYLIFRTKVRTTDIPDNNIRVVELPVGDDDRYSMILAVGEPTAVMIEKVFDRDILSELTLTEDPVTVVIPKLTMSSGMDLLPVLRRRGLDSVFTDTEYTSHISDPAALPMGFLQRVDVNVTGSWSGNEEERGGLLELSADDIQFFDEYVRKFQYSNPDNHFIANRPFVFSLYETSIGVPIYTGAYSYPGEKGKQRIFTQTIPL